MADDLAHIARIMAAQREAALKLAQLRKASAIRIEASKRLLEATAPLVGADKAQSSQAAPSRRQ